MKLSFVICTYNPPRERLKQVLSCIFRMKSFETGIFEVIVVDNNSKPRLSLDEVSVEGHSATLIQEKIPGLTAARIRGFTDSRGEALVYVDDDNLLADDYGTQALNLLQRHPDIGVFSAQISGRFEIPPDPWMTPYLPYLALTDVKEDRWSFSTEGGCLPVGAGMVVRRDVMAHYADAVDANRGRASMDRTGSSLLAGGDTDIGYAALSLGMGCGWCKDLKVEHIIPTCRLEPEYLRRIVRDVTASHVVLERIHGGGRSSIWIKLKWAILASAGFLFPEKSLLRMRAARSSGKLKGEAIYYRTTRAKSPLL
jgi:hypothetical protein